MISLREKPRWDESGIDYIQSVWATEESQPVYREGIQNALYTSNSVPHWYLLLEGETIIGCGGLITNDFISRMDRWP